MRWTLAALCALLVAGCGHGSSSLSASEAKNLVLKAADLPSGFESFSSGPTSALDVQGTARADLQRFGREGGWVERLRQPSPKRRRSRASTAGFPQAKRAVPWAALFIFVSRLG